MFNSVLNKPLNNEVLLSWVSRFRSLLFPMAIDKKPVVKYVFKANNRANGVVVVSLLLTLDIFHTLF